jgi:integrase
MKLPNGYGSICKVKGNRRNGFIVRVTTGWDMDGKQIRKVLGFVSSQKEGLKLLADFHSSPYDLDYKDVTFSQVWIKVEKILEELVDKDKMSYSNLKGLRSAYENHCKTLYNCRVLDIKYKQLQDIINNAKNKHNNEELGYSGKGYIKTVFTKVFEYSINEYELPIVKNPTERLYVGEKPKSDKHIPFTEEEISILWGLQHIDFAKTMLIMCYTGLRPNELFITKRDNIHFEEEYFITGSKTEAGKNRIIPIHNKIKHLIKYFLDNSKDAEYPFACIIDKFNYGKFSIASNKFMSEYNFDHTPYDCRHTFSTRMKQAGANEYIQKRIMGHVISDLTESVYTHRNIKELVQEVNKMT